MSTETAEPKTITPDEARQQERNLFEKIQQKTTCLTNARNELSRIENDIKNYSSDPWQKAKELVDNIQQQLATEAVDLFDELYCLINQQHDPHKLQRVQNERTRLIDTISSTETSVEDLEQQHDAAARVLQDLQQRVEQKHEQEKAELARQYRERQEVSEKAHTLRGRAERIRRKRRELHDRITISKSIFTDKEQSRIRVQSELDALLSNGGEVPFEQLESQKESIQTAINECRLQIEAKQRYGAIETELQKCIETAEQSEQSHQIFKDLADGVRYVRESLMDSMVSPLLDRMNLFFQAAALGRSAYCCLLSDRNRPVFELGWQVGDTKIPLPSLSGGESAIFMAGLAVAMVGLSDVPLKLLIMEAGDMDRGLFDQLLDGLEAVKDDFSNVFIATHLDGVDGIGECWNRIELGVE